MVYSIIYILFRFDYAIDPEQLNYLKLLSNQASQKVILRCEGNSETRLQSLLADDDTILARNGSRRRFLVRKDDCGSATSGETVAFISGRPSLLPIRDVQVQLRPESRFHVQLGEACFSQ
ncbi:unnamed protein product [Echinostoma caproni]|uniref:Fibrillar collagen NC1 domain-containing protein n=1 Tax=Echinostoma caproni TaxID=27848 RepID=A0A183B037_9TREM|nr:unnamed protein product [Echinostoma caproni]